MLLPTQPALAGPIPHSIPTPPLLGLGRTLGFHGSTTVFSGLTAVQVLSGAEEQ